LKHCKPTKKSVPSGYSKKKSIILPLKMQKIHFKGTFMRLKSLNMEIETYKFQNSKHLAQRER
jgi:hypothetical protein